jgi:hypothetical protein
MNTQLTSKPKLLATPPIPILLGGLRDEPIEPPPRYTIETIRIRAETVTALLMAIPDYRPPSHWGINE